ncbi:MAG: hypothetical protein ACFB2Z_08055 [Maricaulaceae bacterium]
MKDVEKQIQDYILKGVIIFDHGRENILKNELLAKNSGVRISEKLQLVVADIAELIVQKNQPKHHLRISSIVRGVGPSHHSTGRAVDIGNENIAPIIMPEIALPKKVSSLSIDEIIIDAGLFGYKNRNIWNFDKGSPHIYDARTLNYHRNHIHIAVLK